MSSHSPRRIGQATHETDGIHLASCERQGRAEDDTSCHKLAHSDSFGLLGTSGEPEGSPRCNVDDRLSEQVNGTPPTRTPETTDSYRARWPSLVRLATGRIEPGEPTSDLIWTVARWLAEARPLYRANTYRQYRAALLWASDQALAPAPAERLQIEALVRAADGAKRHARKRSLPARTSAAKRKLIDDVDFEIVRQTLRTSSVPADADLLTFLEANILVGLRPCEWANANLSVDTLAQAVLKVANRKNTNGRSNGPVRSLIFSAQDSAAAMKKLSSCLNLVACVIGDVPPAGRDRVWSQFCRKLRDRFRTVNHRIWPRRKRHYALYSCRHTLLAAAKTKFDRLEVAALAGHATDETATRHYVRPRKGGGQAPEILPTPAEAEVKTVRITQKGGWLENEINARTTPSRGQR